MVMDLLFNRVIDFQPSLVIESELLTSQRSGLVPRRARYPEALRSPFQVEGQRQDTTMTVPSTKHM